MVMMAENPWKKHCPTAAMGQELQGELGQSQAEYLRVHCFKFSKGKLLFFYLKINFPAVPCFASALSAETAPAGACPLTVLGFPVVFCCKWNISLLIYWSSLTPLLHFLGFFFLFVRGGFCLFLGGIFLGFCLFVPSPPWVCAVLVIPGWKEQSSSLQQGNTSHLLGVDKWHYINSLVNLGHI